MDTIILHSDIARLVLGKFFSIVQLVSVMLCEFFDCAQTIISLHIILGYLKRQNLERTSRLFCKTSPHLKQYFTAYRKGLTPHSFCPDLEEIICEYVNITETGKYCTPKF